MRTESVHFELSLNSIRLTGTTAAGCTNVWHGARDTCQSFGQTSAAIRPTKFALSNSSRPRNSRPRDSYMYSERDVQLRYRCRTCAVWPTNESDPVIKV